MKTIVIDGIEYELVPVKKEKPEPKKEDHVKFDPAFAPGKSRAIGLLFPRDPPGCQHKHYPGHPHEKNL
mgnify:CR=1 FL=1